MRAVTTVLRYRQRDQAYSAIEKVQISRVELLQVGSNGVSYGIEVE